MFPRPKADVAPNSGAATQATVTKRNTFVLGVRKLKTTGSLSSAARSSAETLTRKLKQIKLARPRKNMKN
jgi:hypothetical protein